MDLLNNSSANKSKENKKKLKKQIDSTDAEMNFDDDGSNEKINNFKRQKLGEQNAKKYAKNKTEENSEGTVSGKNGFAGKRIASDDSDKRGKNAKKPRFEENFSAPRNNYNKQGNYNNEGEFTKPDWNKIKKENKQLKDVRKKNDCESSEVYVLSVQAKKIWEEVRRQDCKGAKRDKLCQELYNMIKGKVKSLIYAHDTVRVIETLVGAASDDIRTHLFIELQNEIVNLMKNKYSRFFVIKLLRSGTKIQKDCVMKAMEGHVVKLMRHIIASDVVELAYNDYANATQRSKMLQEFFGPRYRLFKEDVKSLKEAIEKHPEQKESILKEIKKSLDPIIEKGVFTNSIIHTLLKEYLSICDEDSRRSIADSLQEKLLPIVHTRDGAKVAMMCLWHGTPKQRKIMLKTFKENFLKLALDEKAYLVLLAAMDCIDDYSLIKKVVFTELIPEMDKLIESEVGRKVLRYLAAPREKTFFSPVILSVLQEGDGNAYTKKNFYVKYKELQKGAEGIGEPILKLILENVSFWAKDKRWTLFVGAALKNLEGPSKIPIYQAIAEICAEPFVPGEGTHFLEVGFVSNLVKSIIAGDKQRHEAEQPTFTSYLIEAAEDEFRGWSIINRGCFLLTSLIETEIPEVVKKIISICTPLKNKLAKLDFPGAKILLSKL